MLDWVLNTSQYFIIFNFLVFSLFQEIYLQYRLQMNDLKSEHSSSRQSPPQYPAEI